MINLPFLLSAVNEWQGREGVISSPIFISEGCNTRATLIEHPQRPAQGNLLLAVTGLFALNLMAVRNNLQYLILLDRGARVNRCWHEMQNIILATPDSISALEKISAQIYALNSPNLIEQFTEEIKTGQSFLTSPEKYGRIRSLFLNNQIAIKRIHLCDPLSMHHLAYAIHFCGLTIDTIYLSNAALQAKTGKQLTQFHKSLQPLIKSGTWLIDVNFQQGEWRQRVTQIASPNLRLVLKPSIQDSDERQEVASQNF